MRNAPVACAAIAACLAASPSRAENVSCYVNDPTGGPLNIRTLPKGRIVGTVENGSDVTILDRKYDENGRLWAYVLSSFAKGTSQGWVYYKYLAKCSPM